MGSPLGQFERPEPSSVVITRLLVDFLLSGDIAPGQRIPSERSLTETLGAGRSAVREALKSLVLLGVLDARQGDGTYLARTPSELLPQIIGWGLMLGDRTVSDLIETRSHLEITLAGLAAQRRSETQLDGLARVLADMADSGDDLDRYIKADVEFHTSIAECSANKVLIGMHHSVRSLLHVWTSRIILARGSTRTSLALHVPIFDAIREGEAESARRAMTVHMDVATRNLAKVLVAEGRSMSENAD